MFNLKVVRNRKLEGSIPVCSILIKAEMQQYLYTTLTEYAERLLHTPADPFYVSEERT